MALQFQLNNGSLVGLGRDGKVRLVPWESGPPPRIDGYTIGLNHTDPSRAPRHAGERHPDADEVLVMVSGRIQVMLEESDGSESVHEVAAGEGIVIPQGVWHRLQALEPSSFFNITPGPHGEWRPLPQS